MDKREMQELFKATADINKPEGIAAYRAFAAALTTPILQKIELESVMRQLFAVERLAPGAQAVYPVAEDFEIPVWVLPGLGYMAQNFIEGIGEEVYVPTFAINASGDWKITYARDSRIDIAQRAAARAAKDLANYEEECGWRVIMPAATSSFSGKGLLGSRPAPIYEINPASTGAGYLSKELINKMMVGFKRIGRTLTDLYVSPEDAADIREWTDTDIDPVTRREIFQAAGMGSIWNVQLHEMQHLGATGMYNINDAGSGFGKFIAAGSVYNQYTLDNGNVTAPDGTITTLGETQVLGFDLGVNDSLVMPIRKEYEAHDDPTLLRVQKAGFFGWAEIGFACLDSRMIGMGIIDRSL
ncbi:MAG: hypothetical protein ACTSV7_07005 [Candidatus Baldrarchaeia archaeon]